MYSGWPASDEPGRDNTSSRSSSLRSASSRSAGSAPVRPATGPGQNTRPTTAAACAIRLSVASSRSIRAARTACTVSGISTSSMPSVARQRSPTCSIRPPSTSRRTISSRKNGLPSARSRIRSCTDGGRSSTARSARISSSDSSAVSGSRATDDVLRRPPPQPGRVAMRSGRDGHRNRTGPAHPIGQLFEQVEQRVVGPVDVLDHDDDRPAFAERREERSPRGVDLGAHVLGVEIRERDVWILQADRVGEGRRRARRVGGDLEGQQVPTRLAHLLDREIGRVGVEDARVRLEDLRERPVGDAVAVGETPPGEGRSVPSRAMTTTRGTRG